MMTACAASEPEAPSQGADAGTEDPPPVDPPEVKAPVSCLDVGANCRDDANACCNGTVCVFDTEDRSKARCAATCRDGSQCNSGCCTVLIEGTASVCAPETYCAGSCSPPGEECSTVACCENAVCVSSTVTGVSCAARCAAHSQCASGCCAPLSNTGELVCSPVEFCGG